MSGFIPLILTLALGAGEDSAFGTGNLNIDAIPPYVLNGLTGTVWKEHANVGTDGAMEFLAGGILNYIDSAGQSFPGRWEQAGDAVHFEINRYSQHVAIVRGPTMAGRAWNLGGQNWDWQAQRQ